VAYISSFDGMLVFLAQESEGEFYLKGCYSLFLLRSLIILRISCKLSFDR